jgi:hypothetical protein
MGFFGNAKAFLSGSHAKVTIDMPKVGFVNMPVAVKVKADARIDFEVKAVYVDVIAVEKVEVKGPNGDTVQQSETLFHKEFQIAGSCAMKLGENREWTGTVLLPSELQPTFKGKLSGHTVSLRGRLEAKGNDPDTGYIELRVAAMS